MTAQSETLGQYLKSRRTRAGFTQQQLSERSGISQARISRLENDEADWRIADLNALRVQVGLNPKRFLTLNVNQDQCGGLLAYEQIHGIRLSRADATGRHWFRYECETCRFPGETEGSPLRCRRPKEQA